MMTASAQASPHAEAAEAHRDRITGIDCGRFIAVLAVIFIHAKTARPESVAAEIAARFAVPFFFVTAGFFLSHAGPPTLQSLGRVCRRLLIPFLFWLAVYLCWFRPELSDFRSPKYVALLFIRGGPANHLWFLPSLTVCSVLLLGAIRAGLSLRALIVISALLYAVGLAFGAYYEPLTGHTHFPWDTRDGPFFGFPLMVIGLAIARAGLSVGPATALGIFLLGGAIQGAEAYGLRAAGFEVMHDQLIGTALFGTGFFLLVRHIAETPLALRIASLGRYSLGIYVVHVLFLQIVVLMSARGLFADTRTDIGELAAIAVVAAVSTAFCIAVGEIKALRPLVR